MSREGDLGDAASEAVGRLEVAHYLLDHGDKMEWSECVIEELVSQAITVLRVALKPTQEGGTA